MALHCGRITAGVRHLDRSKWLRQSSRSADISRLPLNYVNQQRPGMVLRSRLLVVGTVGIGGTWDGEEKEVSPCSYAVGDLAEKSGSEEDQRVEEDEDSASRDRTVKVAVAAAAMMVLGVGNRVLYKLALVPLKHYPLFLAQLVTFGYVVVYFSILYLRYHAGIVTDEMLSMQKAPFLAVGLLEALGAATGMAAGEILSGASIPILSQMTIEGLKHIGQQQQNRALDDHARFCTLMCLEKSKVAHLEYNIIALWIVI